MKMLIDFSVISKPIVSSSTPLNVSVVQMKHIRLNIG
ncbi:hypothetical protein ACHAXS_001104 [Conticribra weissflogii]